MKLMIFCPFWGSEKLPFKDFCRRAAAVGYNGVELSFEADDTAGAERIKILKDAGLQFIAQHWQTVEANVDAHILNFRRRLEWAAQLDPLFINSQSGRDWFTFEENCRVLEVAEQVRRETGVKILHETHRGKFNFCAAVTQRFLKQFPDLRLAADFSHWCAVSESLLEDQSQSVEAAIERADHIHARVGYQEGPQVSDPQAPEWAGAVNAHLKWWDRIVELHLQRNTPVLTVLPEFGPFPYMPALPFTRQPVTSQWDANVYMMNLLRNRYKDRCEV